MKKYSKKYPKPEDRNLAIDEIAKKFGTENPSTSPKETYTDYYSKGYKEWWDTNVKRDPF